MNLSDIAKKIISEDTWGNNPSAAGGMSPGRTPTATPPPATPNAKMIDISNLFKNFKSQLEKQEDAAIRKLENDLKRQFLKKHVKVKASKGSVGQIEKEYDVTVNNIDVRYMKDKYYIVFNGKEGNSAESEYYLDDSVIEVDNTAAPVSPTGTTGGMSVTPQSTGNTNRNIVPQR
jgi:hypothetical protein